MVELVCALANLSSLPFQQPPLVMNDFMRAIQAVRPTVTEADSA